MAEKKKIVVLKSEWIELNEEQKKMGKKEGKKNIFVRWKRRNYKSWQHETDIWTINKNTTKSKDILFIIKE